MSVPYTDSEASEARQWSNRYGPPNAWTASLGTAARMIGRLLDERERLMAKQTVAAPGDDYIREWHEEFQRWKAVAEEKQDLRDHFAAAALTGLVDTHAVYHREPPALARMAYAMADAMLRERCRAGADCPAPDNAANHDAAPAVKAGTPGTGDTPEIAAFRRFVGQVMNWISEATSAYAPACSSEGGRKIMADACSRCWDAFDRIAPTDHGASPEAIASVESVAPQPTTRGDSDRTDKAAPRPSEGTGDTPATHATRGECSEPREGTEPVAWAVMDGHEFMEFCTDNEEAKCAAGFYGDCPIVPLYRQPPRQDVSRKNLTLTDADAETLRELRDEAAQYADEIGLCASEVKVRQRIIDGLLERTGGER